MTRDGAPTPEAGDSLAGGMTMTNETKCEGCDGPDAETDGLGNYFCRKCIAEAHADYRALIASGKCDACYCMDCGTGAEVRS